MLLAEEERFHLLGDLHLHRLADLCITAPETDDDEDAYRKNDVHGRRARIHVLYCSTAGCKSSDLLLHAPMVDRYRIADVVH